MKLRALGYAEAEAVAAAVRWFWGHCGDIDHQTDNWWTAAFRQARVKGL